MKESDEDEYSDSEAIHMKDPIDESNTPITQDINNNNTAKLEPQTLASGRRLKSSLRKNMSTAVIPNSEEHVQTVPMPRNFSESFHKLQNRRPTIFDSMDTESNENDSRVNLLSISNEGSDAWSHGESVVPSADNDFQMSESQSENAPRYQARSILRDSIKETRHVDFNVVGSCERACLKKTGSQCRHKTTLKHFNIDSLSLMSQNVDENEEYEPIIKETSKLLNQNTDSTIGSKTTQLKSSLVVPDKYSTPHSSSGTQIAKPITEKNPSTSGIINNSGINNERPMQSKFAEEELHKPAGKLKKFDKKSKNNKKSSNHNKLVKNNHSVIKPREVFIELQELREFSDPLDPDYASNHSTQYEWQEVSRWIKYEQTVNSETNLWGKPFVGALVYRSLLYLKTGLQYGTVILDSDKTSYAGVIDEMCQDFINSGHMYKETKEKLKQTLLSQHAHVIRPSGLSRKKSSISLAFSSNRRQSTFNDLLANSSRKNSSAVQINEMTSNRVISENKLMSISDADLENGMNHSGKISSCDGNSNSVKFFTPEDNNQNNLANNRYKRRRSTIALIKGSMSGGTRGSVKHGSKSDVGMSQDAEACAIMVGVVDFLDRPVMGFIRLQNTQMIDDMVEIQLKVRFVFVLLGPKNDNIDYLEIGRCIGTLMTNKDFHETAYRATDRRDLINSISSFTNKSLCLVLPVGNFDEDLLTPIIEWMQETMKKKTSSSESDIKIYDKSSQEGTGGGNGSGDKAVRHSSSSPDEEQDEVEIDPFQKTNRPFGCLINEIKHRYSSYVSDYKDALNWHCLIAFVFIFTVCFAPALSFGGILAEKTEKSFGVNEMLIATSLNGIISGLFSGQPIMIYGATGPFLVFEEMLHYYCKILCIEYLAIRVWVALWVLVISLFLLSMEGVYLIKYVTRFTEEIFAMLIACVFLFDAVKIIFQIFNDDPIMDNYCELSNETNRSQSMLVNYTNTCEMYTIHNKKPDQIPVPNKALISFCLLIGTCVLAMCLKKLRRSVFFGSYIRRTLSDVGMFVSIVLMVLVDFYIEDKTKVITKKLNIPDDFHTPTDRTRRSWFVSPFGNNFIDDSSMVLEPQYWFFSIFPALLVFIVIYFEVEVIGLILHSKHRKLKKGCGFNLDLLIAALMMTLNSFFGLPWMCAAPVRTLAHWASLTVYSSNYIPGEKPKLIEVKEQRLTNIMVHLAIGLCLLAKDALKMIPVSVLFGIFLYFGIVSLSGTQLYERIRLFFIPSKYCPNIVYARGVRPSKRNMFTLIQVLAVLFLIIIKSKNQISFTFPLLLVMLVPLRMYVLPKFFSNKELEQLDHCKDSQSISDMDQDFYELTHLPI